MKIKESEICEQISLNYFAKVFPFRAFISVYLCSSVDKEDFS